MISWCFHLINFKFIFIIFSELVLCLSVTRFWCQIIILSLGYRWFIIFTGIVRPKLDTLRRPLSWGGDRIKFAILFTMLNWNLFTALFTLLERFQNLSHIFSHSNSSPFEFIRWIKWPTGHDKTPDHHHQREKAWEQSDESVITLSFRVKIIQIILVRFHELLLNPGTPIQRVDLGVQRIAKG